MRREISKVSWLGAAAAALLCIAATPPAGTSVSAPKLHIEEVGSDSTAFDVVSTIIVGPTEALLWDTQYHVKDAQRLADRIAATGKHLKAIVISHPDHDHYMGASTIVERFPGTPVYMTPAALVGYKKTAAQNLANEQRRPGAPDSIVTPQPLPSNTLTVDGENIEVIPDVNGDVEVPTNSMLWIPSLQTLLAADVVFNGVHPWLGSSSEASRAAWLQVLQRIQDKHPAVVVAGHKKDINAPDSPESVAFMRRYLTDFESLRKSSSNGQELASAMHAKYPDLAVPVLLNYSAQVAYKKAP